MIFVDTSVWSLALRRDGQRNEPHVLRLTQALETGESLYITGLVLQELLQGFHGPKGKRAILDRFSSLPVIAPQRSDHIDAAELRNRCRRTGIQIGTIDALIAHLCVRHGLLLLTTDQDFEKIKTVFPLRVWRP